MSCNGCYDGCVEITSDNCVKYTGPNIEALGIVTGDTLAGVEAAIIQYLQSALDASGISWTIPPANICALISLPNPYTLVDIINSIFDAICTLDTRLTDSEAELATLNADYNVDCLTGVNASSDTHAVLQATITELCTLVTTVAGLATQFADYVLIADINAYIQNYLDSIAPPSTKHYTKMVPYVAVEFYSDIAGKFDATGKGLVGTDWEKIYLCNGQNGTPDKRGRIAIGTTTMGNTPFDHMVDPGVDNNPTYDLLTKQGMNFVALADKKYMPPHTHVATVVVSESPHTHSFTEGESYLSSPPSGIAGAGGVNPIIVNTTPAKTNLTVAVTNSSVGGGEPHVNIPPVLACHYIMYIP